jgi:Tripartite tricarboxylate transporter TctB family
VFDAFRHKKRKRIGSVALYYLPTRPQHRNFQRQDRRESQADCKDRLEKNKRESALPGRARRMYLSNRNFVAGLFMIAFALLFGLAALKYQLGTFSRSGPGLFPLMVSSLLGVIGVISVVRSRFVPPVPLSYSIKNIAIIMLSLCGFAVVSGLINMIVGIVFLVFCSTLAGTSYSLVRNVKISLGLIAVAFAFRNLLGLNLPLF